MISLFHVNSKVLLTSGYSFVIKEFSDVSLQRMKSLLYFFNLGRSGAWSCDGQHDRWSRTFETEGRQAQSNGKRPARRRTGKKCHSPFVIISFFRSSFNSRPIDKAPLSRSNIKSIDSDIIPIESPSRRHGLKPIAFKGAVS